MGRQYRSRAGAGEVVKPVDRPPSADLGFPLDGEASVAFLRAEANAVDRLDPPSYRGPRRRPLALLGDRPPGAGP